MTINQRIASLRKVLLEEKADAIIISGSDPHQSEYIADAWQDRKWISGFTGSAGIVVITKDHAGLWTDVRYWIQAEQEFSDSEMTLHKQKSQFQPEHLIWLKEKLHKGCTVAVDGKDFSIAQLRSIKSTLGSDINVSYRKDLMSKVWTDRPSLPVNNIFQHDLSLTGLSRNDKIGNIRSQMREAGADSYLLTALDEIAYALNLRGSDVECNPVFISYFIIEDDKSLLFVDADKLEKSLLSELESQNIIIRPYEQIIAYVNQIDENVRIMVDPSQCNALVFESINGEIIESKSIVKHLKAQKNKIEIGHIKNCMIKDGAALANAFYWMENQLDSGLTFTEFEFAQKLNEFRSRQENYVGESFSAIVGYESNGAIMHYRPLESTSKTIRKEGILLCDSGGQYLDGTTDITRTFALGTPKKEQKKNFTAVLKGMIALSSAIFPQGTNGGQLDILARQFLWNKGLNFGHGTGHGVGFFLNVHEPPQGFAPGNSERSRTIQKEGMLTSNEPGYYEDGSYGIRIENLILTKKHSTYEGYLCFEDVTLYPIDISLIDEDDMTSKEKAWLNNYHHKVFKLISPLLDEEVRSWFKWKCRPMN